jgi:hypothetical protein
MIRGIVNLFSGKLNPYFLFGLILIIYILSGFGVTVSNDATTNMEQITAMNIWSRSAHFTFHLFGILFYIIFSKVIGLPPITSVELMLSLFCLAGTVALYYITLNKFEDKRIAFVTVILYALSSGIFRFSIQAEYLVLIPSLALISLAFYAYKRYVLSGIALAMGLLTSPFILLFTPAYLLYNTLKTLPSKRNLLFTSGFLGLYLIISFFTFKETVRGEWSYGLVFNHYKEGIFNINYLRVAAIWVYGYLRSFLIVIPFIFAGLVICYKMERKLFYIILLMGVIHLPLAIPEGRYGAYQFTFYPFVSILAAMGIHSLFIHNKTLAGIVLSMFLIVNFYIVLSERDFNRDLRDTYVMIQHEKTIPDSSILFVYQAVKPIQTQYAPRIKPISIRTKYQENMLENLPGYRKPELREIISENEHLYLLESGTSMPDDHFKLLFSAFVKGQGAKVKGFGKEKLIPFLPGADFILLESYPIELYNINK